MIRNSFKFTLGNLTPDLRYAQVLQKRDQEVSLRNVTALIAARPKYLLDLTHSEGITTSSLNLHPQLIRNSTAQSKRDWQDNGHKSSTGAGLKFSVCPVHPEHHLTVQHDWDTAVWDVDNNNLGDFMAYYNANLAPIDMNDYQQGGWRTLMHTGKLTLEENTGFGSNFETCDGDVFTGLAH